MTWLVGPTMLTCQLTGRWHGMPTMYANVIIMSCWHHPYPGKSCGSGHLVFGSGLPFGRRRRVARVWRVGSLFSSACWRVRACPTSKFYAVFTNGFVSSSSTQWYGQNIILTTFIFEQKSNTTLNHKLWYQLLGIPAPHAEWWCLWSLLKGD